MGHEKQTKASPLLFSLFRPSPPACPPAAPRRETRISRSKRERSEKGGHECYARYGPDHYRRLQKLSAAAQAQRVREPLPPYSVTRLSPVGYATLQRIAAETGLSQSAILREAWEAQLRHWAERNPPR